MGEAEANGGLLDSVRRLGLTAAAVVQNRAELLLVEWQEERVKLLEAIVLVAALGVFTLLTLLLATAVIVFYCLQYHYLVGLVILGGLYLVGTLAAFWRLRIHLRNVMPFSASLAELKKDKACLGSKNESAYASTARL